jgi:hypothetical protein
MHQNSRGEPEVGGTKEDTFSYDSSDQSAIEDKDIQK